MVMEGWGTVCEDSGSYEPHKCNLVGWLVGIWSEGGEGGGAPAAVEAVLDSAAAAAAVQTAQGIRIHMRRDGTIPQTSKHVPCCDMRKGGWRYCSLLLLLHIHHTLAHYSTVCCAPLNLVAAGGHACAVYKDVLQGAGVLDALLFALTDSAIMCDLTLLQVSQSLGFTVKFTVVLSLRA